MIKRIFTTLLAVSIMALPLTACGGNPKSSNSGSEDSNTASSDNNVSSGQDVESDGSNTNSDSNTTVAGNTSKATNTTKAQSGKTTQSGNKKTLRIWGYQDDEALLSAVTDYESSHSNVMFQINTPQEYTLEYLQVAMAAGQEPDILMLDHVYITSLGRQGKLKNLVQYGANNIKSKYISAVWNAISFKGDVFGLPHNGNTVALMYNKDMLDKTGKKAPTTYNDLVSVAQSMKATSPAKTPFTAPFFENSSSNRLNWAAFEYFFWLWRSGGDILNSDYTKATFNSTAGVEALQMLIDLVKKGVTPGDKYMESEFYYGDVGMIEMGCWSLPQLIRQDKNANFGVAMLPKLKDNVPNYSGLGLFALGITDSCENPAIAYDFLAKYTTTTEYQLQYSKQNNSLPVTNEALNDSYYKTDLWQTYIAQYKLSKSRPGVACWDQVEKEIANAVTSAVKNEKSAKAALDAAAATVNKLLAAEKK